MKRKPKLTIELVPQTSWFTNLRSILSGTKWDVLRRHVYIKAGYRCEICNGVGKSHPVECHEVWRYDDEKYRQVLIAVIALCPECHKVKHIGLAEVRGYRDYAEEHLANINKWTLTQAREYIDEVFTKWETRSQHYWKVDVSFANLLLEKMK